MRWNRKVVFGQRVHDKLADDLFAAETKFQQDLEANDYATCLIAIPTIMNLATQLERDDILTKYPIMEDQLIKTQAKVEEERNRLERLQRLVRTSLRVKRDVIGEFLRLPYEELLEHLANWAEKFGFKLDADYVIFGGGRKDDFIEELDREFKYWNDVSSFSGKVDTIPSTASNQPAHPPGNVIFISYVHIESEYYQVAEVARQLQSRGGIAEIFYSQRDVVDNFIRYLNSSLERCDIFLLFCSPKASQSRWVTSEWSAAETRGIPIIPIFREMTDVPALLGPRNGVQFDPENLPQLVQELYDLILCKTS